MRTAIVLLLLAALAPVAAASTRDARTALPSFECFLTGTIGSQPVEMYIEGSAWSDGDGPIYSLSGHYFYTKPGVAVARSIVDGLSVGGEVDRAGRFVLEENEIHDFERRKTGTLSGRIAVDTSGPRPVVRIDGTWSAHDRRLRFALAEYREPAVGYTIESAIKENVDEATDSSYDLKYPRMAGPGSHVAGFNRAVEAHVERLIAAFRRDVAVNADNEDHERARSSSSMHLAFDVAFASRTVVSIRFHQYYAPFWFLAWPLTSNWGITYDLERGREVELVDVIGEQGELECTPTARRLAEGHEWAADLEEDGGLNEPMSWQLRPDGVTIYYLIDRRLGGTAELVLPLANPVARLAAAPRAAEPDAPLRRFGFGRVLVGTIGDRKVEMYIEGERHENYGEPYYALWGYYHDDAAGAWSPRDGIRFEGTVEPDGRFELRQTDDMNQRVGLLRGRLVVETTGELPVVRVAGVASSGRRNVRFALTEPPQQPRGYRVSSETLRWEHGEIDYPRLSGTKWDDTLNALVVAKVRVLAAEYDEAVAKWRTQDGAGQETPALVVRFDVAYASPAAVSLRFHEHAPQQNGVWWPIRKRWGVTFDLETGHEMEIEDVFGAAEGRSPLKPALEAVAKGKRWAEDVIEFHDPFDPLSWNLRPDGVSVYYLGDERNGGFGELVLRR